MNTPLPDNIDFSKGVYTLIKNKDWILQWNREFFNNPENNIDECIKKLEYDIEKYENSNLYDLISINNFRLMILNTIKAEMQKK